MKETLDIIQLFVVDDSAIVRQTITRLLENVSDIEVLGVAADPLFAMKKFEALGLPDVLLLDLEMPRMDGLTFLKKIMSKTPIPVIICSAHATDGSSKAIEALQHGAVELIVKPNINTKTFFEESKEELIHSIRSAFNAHVKKVKKHKEKHTPKPMHKDKKVKSVARNTPLSGKKVVAIGSSTGGVQVLEKILSNLPSVTPPILITQHMPAGFTASLAKRLDQLSLINVKEAEDGDLVQLSTAYIAPGGKHLQITQAKNGYMISIKDGPKVSRHRPSVDVLFNSMSQEVGSSGVGFILTGMGSDGARGMREMMNKGALTYAQDEESCVVYGMPYEAVKLGGVAKSVEISEIVDLIKNSS